MRKLAALSCFVLSYLALPSGLVLAQDPDLTLRVSTPSTVNLGSTFDANVVFDNVGPNDVDGCSYGLCHDGTKLTMDSFVDSALIQTVNGGNPPGFGSTTIVDPAQGGTQGIVVDLFGINKIPPGVGYELIDITYTVVAPSDDTTTLSFCDTLGAPPVAVVIVIAGGSIVPTLMQTQLSLITFSAPEFVRGECNGDQVYDIADAIWLLNMLFQGGPMATCLEACDANNDGTVDSADATFTLTYQLLLGPPPPAPFPDCGTDPETPDTADCVLGCP